MSAPFYKIYLSGDGKRDISEFISSFDYEDCMGEDSMLELRVHTQKVLDLLNNDKIDADTKLYFQFGFLGEVPSKVHVAVIKDLDTSYGQGGESLTIRALDKGVDMKRSSNAKVWKKVTSSQIAEQIAKRYGLTAVIEPTKTVHSSKAQGNRSDLEFLRYLASREDDGNYVTYIRNDSLYFVKRNLAQPSTRTFTWRGAEGNVISFSPKYRESTKPKTSSKTVMAGADKKEKPKEDKSWYGSMFDSEASNETEKGETTLGDAKLQMGSLYDGVTGNKLGRRIATPEKKREATNLANSHKKKADLKILGATLVTLGDPFAEPNTVVTIAGAADRHNGNWLVEKVKHTINGSGYQTSREMVKNGKKKGTVKAKNKNTTVGPKTKQEKVKVNRYDGVTGNKLSK